mmetsp:Transcript_8232/g.23456  ORF Transcript_8232/g.23456 Transcript_8232/m.23456 type:complete len:242 (+) Transcript_8232:3772-4497(+)
MHRVVLDLGHGDGSEGAGAYVQRNVIPAKPLRGERVQELVGEVQACRRGGDGPRRLRVGVHRLVVFRVLGPRGALHVRRQRHVARGAEDVLRNLGRARAQELHRRVDAIVLALLLPEAVDARDADLGGLGPIERKRVPDSERGRPHEAPPDLAHHRLAQRHGGVVARRLRAQEHHLDAAGRRGRRGGGAGGCAEEPRSEDAGLVEHEVHVAREQRREVREAQVRHVAEGLLHSPQLPKLHA